VAGKPQGFTEDAIDEALSHLLKVGRIEKPERGWYGAGSWRLEAKSVLAKGIPIGLWLDPTSRSPGTIRKAGFTSTSFRVPGSLVGGKETRKPDAPLLLDIPSGVDPPRGQVLPAGPIVRSVPSRPPRSRARDRESRRSRPRSSRRRTTSHIASRSFERPTHRPAP
jgi:hypothetical protein